MIQGCLFDMDGILLDTENLGMRLFSEISQNYGYDFPGTLYLKILGTNHHRSRKVLVRELGADFPADTVMKEMFDALLECARKGTMPIKPGVEACFQGLRERGIRMALATSTDKAVVKQYLELIPELRGVFDAVVCGSEVGESKPAPDIYLLAAERLGLTPMDCIGVEDSRNGLKSLTAAGIPSVMIPDLLPFDESLKPFTTWKLNSLTELCPLIDTL